jgi:hypothetical protein
LQVMQPVLDLGTLVLGLLVASTFRAKFIDIGASAITIAVPRSKEMSLVIACKYHKLARGPMSTLGL